MAACHPSGSGGVQPLILTHADSLKDQAVIERAYQSIAKINHQIQSGDLITRTGNDFTSESLRQLNQREKTYSHCGIASIEHDSIFIYHALGGEFNPDQKLRRDPLDLFANPEGNRGMGVFRYQISSTQVERLILTIRHFYRSGIMFDLNFDLKSDDRMYCAEFVYKSLLIATENKLPFNISHIKDFKFIGVDDLFLQPSCKEILRIIYK